MTPCHYCNQPARHAVEARKGDDYRGLITCGWHFTKAAAYVQRNGGALIVTPVDGPAADPDLLDLIAGDTP